MSGQQRQVRTHFCLKCNFPIAYFGRLSPCMHAFCLHCSSEMTECHLCGAHINQAEKVASTDDIYISAATLQSFTSRDDFRAHEEAVQNRLRNQQF